jgi:lambda repressor-like predicted transcriptional regulator
MHPEDIKAELRKLGFKQRDVSRLLGLSDEIVHNVIQGRTTSFRCAKLIAELIDRDIDEIWPGRYSRRLRQHQAALAA